MIRKSPYSVKKSVDLLANFLMRQGLTIYKRIDQQQEIKRSGLEMLPLEFILFGNPAAGGHLMKKHPLIALDLPLKVIVWEDTDQQIWLAYNSGSYLEQRYDLQPDPDSPLDLGKMIDAVFGRCDC